MKYFYILHLFLFPYITSAYEIAPITNQMRQAAQQIEDYLLPQNGVTQQSSIAWQRLAYICDTFGPRFSGSQALEGTYYVQHNMMV
jgi:hypothetical protein